jgi:hypothetical protein
MVVLVDVIAVEEHEVEDVAAFAGLGDAQHLTGDDVYRSAHGLHGRLRTLRLEEELLDNRPSGVLGDQLVVPLLVDRQNALFCACVVCHGC